MHLLNILLMWFSYKKDLNDFKISFYRVTRNKIGLHARQTHFKTLECLNTNSKQ